MREEYVRPQVVQIGRVTSLTLSNSGASGGGGGGGGSKPGTRIDGSGCTLVPQGDGNKGNGPCK